MRFVLLAAMLALTACISDEPASSVPTTPGDAGTAPPPADGGGGSIGANELPLLDRWDVSVDDFPAAADNCEFATEKALADMGGGYTMPSSGIARNRTAERPGAVLFTLCTRNGASASIVLTAAFGIAGALDAQNDNGRLFELASGGSAKVASAASSTALPLRAAQGGLLPVPAGMTQALCRDKAKATIATMLQPSFSQESAAFLAIGGRSGTTVAISCVGAQLANVVIHVVTVDPAVNPADLGIRVREAMSK